MSRFEHEGEPHLRELHDGVPRRATGAERDEDRGRWIVVVPDVVADRLVVPLPLPRFRIEREDAVGKQIGAAPEAAIEVLGRRSRRAEHPAALLIDRDAAPRVGPAVALAGDEAPGVVTELAFAWNGVEDPPERPSRRVVRADVSRRRVVALVHARSQNQQVLVHRARRRHLEAHRGRLDAEVFSQVDVSAPAERPNEAAVRSAQRIDAVLDEVKDALALGPLPVRDAAVAEPDDLPVVVRRGIEDPPLAASGRVERHGLQAGCRHIHHAAHDDRVDVHRGARGGIARAVLPGGLEPVHVGRVDVGEGRILIRLRVASIDRPVDVDATRRGARRDAGSRQAGEQHERAEATRASHRDEPSSAGRASVGTPAGAATRTAGMSCQQSTARRFSNAAAWK